MPTSESPQDSPRDIGDQVHDARASRKKQNQITHWIGVRNALRDQLRKANERLRQMGHQDKDM